MKKVISSILVIAMLFTCGLSNFAALAADKPNVNVAITKENLNKIVEVIANSFPGNTDQAQAAYGEINKYMRTNGGIDYLIGLVENPSKAPSVVKPIFDKIGAQLTTYKNETIFILESIKAIPEKARQDALTRFANRDTDSITYNAAGEAALDAVKAFVVGSTDVSEFDKYRVNENTALLLFTALKGQVVFTNAETDTTKFKVKSINETFGNALVTNLTEKLGSINGTPIATTATSGKPLGMDVLDAIVSSLNSLDSTFRTNLQIVLAHSDIALFEASGSRNVNIALTKENINKIVEVIANSFPGNTSEAQAAYAEINKYMQTDGGIDYLIGLVENPSKAPSVVKPIFDKIGAQLETYKNEAIFILESIKAIPVGNRTNALARFANRDTDSITYNAAGEAALDAVKKFVVGSTDVSEFDKYGVNENTALLLFTALKGQVVFTNDKTDATKFAIKDGSIDVTFNSALSTNLRKWFDSVNGEDGYDTEFVIQAIVNTLNSMDSTFRTNLQIVLAHSDIALFEASGSRNVNIALTKENINKIVEVIANSFPGNTSQAQAAYAEINRYMQTNEGIDYLISLVENPSKAPSVVKPIFDKIGAQLETYKNETIFILESIKAIPVGNRTNALARFANRDTDSITYNAAGETALDAVKEFVVGSTDISEIEALGVNENTAMLLFTALKDQIQFTNEGTDHTKFALKTLNSTFGNSLTNNLKEKFDTVNNKAITTENVIGAIVETLNLMDSGFRSNLQIVLAHSDIDLFEKGQFIYTVDTIADQTYTGSEIKPAPVVKARLNGSTVEVTLTAGKDYDVSYLNNKDVGNATVNITMKGIYAGDTASKGFQILPKTGAYSIDPIAKQTYTGEEIKPDVVVKDGETELTLGTDYTVAFGNNINAGTATVTISFQGNYANPVTPLTATFVIGPKTGTYSIAPINEQTYTGSPITPVITVKDGETELMLDKDYTVEYGNNTNAGTATVTVNFKGNYAGSANSTFIIGRRDGSACIISAIDDQKHTGSEITPDIEVLDGTKPVDSSNYTVKYENNIAVGTAKVTVTFKDDGNYSGEISTTFKIVPSTQIIYKIADIAPQTYTGSEIKPAIKVLRDEVELDSQYYDVTYSNNIEAGNEALVTVKFKGDYAGVPEITKNFVIKPKSGAGLNITLEPVPPYTYTGSPIEPTVVVKDGDTKLTLDTDYTVAYSPDHTNVGEVTVTVTFKGNYEGTNSNTKFNIGAKDGSGFTVKVADGIFTYNGSAHTPAIQVFDGEMEVPASSYSVVYSDNVNAGQAKIEVSFSGNYSGKANGEFTINAKSANDLTYDAIPDQTYTGSPITPQVTVKDGETTLSDTYYTVEYTNNTEPGEATATITFNGNYTGSYTLNFNIVKSGEETEYTITEIEDQTYTGSKIEPEIEVKDKNGNIVTPDEVLYENNTDAGTATVIVMIGGKEVASATFTIKPKSASGLSIDSISDKRYTGDPIRPGVTVRDNGDIVSSENYDVSYRDNTEPGTASVTITFKKNYEGTKYTSFVIYERSSGSSSNDGYYRPSGNKTPAPTAIPSPDIANADQVFPDTANHWSKDYVGNAVSNGWFIGYENGRFEPDWGLTRQEMAVVLTRVLGRTGEAASAPNADYADQSEIGAWAVGAVNLLSAEGILKGYEDGEFKPDKEITREEFATILMRLLEDRNYTARLNFLDNDSIGEWAKTYVGQAANTGIVNGYEDKTFRPKNVVTRAEAAKMLYGFNYTRNNG